MNFRTQLGLALKRQRERRDLTQETLAEMANISVRHLAAMEAGTKNFTIEVLEQLATALDWDPLAELTREGPPLSEAQAREVAERLGELNAEWEATFERLKALHALSVAANNPGQPETAQADAVRPDIAQADAAQADAAQADAAQADTAPPDTAPPNTAPPDTPQADPSQANTAQADAARPGAARANTPRADSVEGRAAADPGLRPRGAGRNTVH